MVVELTPREMFHAATIGVFRQVENVSRGRRDAHGASVSLGWQMHVEGALGELAFAKALGLYWSGALAFRESDVGPWEVRTAAKNTHSLIVHPGDRDDSRFVLVTGVNGSYMIQGWVLGKYAKQEKWWSDPAGGRPAYFVPISALTNDWGKMR